MRRLFTALLLAIFCSVGAADTNAPAGDWLGTLEISGVKLRLLFKIRRESDKSFIGTMDSVDQGARDILIDKLGFKDNELRLEIKLIEAVYEGKYQSAADKFEGNWVQGSRPLPLTLVRTNATRLILGAATAADMTASKHAAEKLAGTWNAILKSGADQFRLALNIRTNRDGAAIGTLDSLDQGLTGIPVSAITYKDGNVHFEARGMTASYDGVSFNNSTTVTGQWKQAGQTLPLKFTRSSSGKSSVSPATQ